jgi:DNA-binding winged helix-turn-helix (wHTH) protein
MEQSVRIAYRFQAFRLGALRRRLFGPDGQAIPLPPRAFDTLLYLVERPGELHERRAMLEAIWPHVVIQENNLDRAISTVRSGKHEGSTASS